MRREPLFVELARTCSRTHTTDAGSERGDAPVMAVRCTAVATPASGEAGSQLTEPGVSVTVPSIAGALAAACSLAAACINTSGSAIAPVWLAAAASIYRASHRV